MKALVTIFLCIFCFSSCTPQETRVWVPDGYRSWDKTVEEVLTYPIAGHGPTLRIIYINAIGEQVKKTVQDGRTMYDYPAGSIIVKEIYRDQAAVDAQTPFQLTVMVKDPQSPKTRDGWVWVVKDMESGGETVFESRFCLDCHSDANERHALGKGNADVEFRDYIFFPLDEYGSIGEDGSESDVPSPYGY